MKNSSLLQLANTVNFDEDYKTKKFYELRVILYAFFGVLIVNILFTIPLIIYLTMTQGIEDLQATIESPQNAYLSFAILFCSFIGIYLLAWLWLRKIEHRAFSSLGFQRNGALKLYTRGLLFGVGAIVLITLVFAALGMISWEQPFQGLSPAILGSLCLLFLGFVIQAGAEEVLVRGFLLPILARKYSVWLSITISSLFFLLLHVLNPNFGYIPAANLFLAGVFFSVYALKEGSLWGVCGLHAAWNWAMGHLVGFQVSGQTFGGPNSIFIDLQEAGPDWLTGGDFGPEGGLGVTLILVLAILYLNSRPTTINLDQHIST